MTISLLVVSQSYSIREMLARYLPYEEFTVYTANSIEMAMGFFPKLSLNAVLIELQFQSLSGLDLLAWMGDNYPDIHPVILCEEYDSDLVELIRIRKASYLIKNKLNLLNFRLQLQAMCQNRRGLTYQFNRVSLFELVKLVSFSGYDYHLYLTSPQTRQEGLIYFGEGKVQQAMYGEISGEEAFYEIMKMKRGLFSEMQVIDTEDATIQSSLDQLMANSALIEDTGDKSRQVQLPPTYCLILSNEVFLPTFIGELFRFHKDSVLETTWVESEEKAFEKLIENPELIILDTDMPGLKPKRILDYIDGNYLDTRVILMGDNLTSAIHKTLNHASVVRFFLKSAQYQELAELIEQTYLAQQFTGELLDLSLFGVLQIFSYCRQARLLEVTDFFSGEAGQIFMNEGEVLHATFGKDIGRDALKSILKINYGVYRQEAYWEPVTNSLNIPFNRLMMYLSRFMEDTTPHNMARDLLLQSGETISIKSNNIDSLIQT